MLLLEHWKPVVGYEGYYEVSNVGNVRRRDGRLMRPWLPDGRYQQIQLYCDGIRTAHYIQVLVAAAFIGPCPAGLEVNHINGYKVKNWVSNLEYLTHQDNTRHAVQNGLQLIGAFGKKLGDEDVRMIRWLCKTMTPTEIARIYNVSRVLISRIKHGHQRKTA
jgi:NUMOD4 motif/HNH endonuclease